MLHQKCAYWDTSGFREVLPWLSTLEKVQYHQHMKSRKIHWTLITEEMREGLQIDFSQETFFECFFGTLLWNISVQNPPPPPQKKKSIYFRIGLAYSKYAFNLPRWEIQQDGPVLKLYRVQRRHAKFKSTTNHQLQNWYFLGIREISQDKTPSSQTSIGRFSEKGRFVPSLP